jgi:lysophospholipase L1-like esterase
LSRVAAGALVLLLGAGCSTPASSPPAPSAPSPSSRATSAVTSTPGLSRLDSIVVIGHSGATGIRADPADPKRSASEFSWATGQSPEVDSIYRRLLADHPALEGNNVNLAVNGTKVGGLERQLDRLLTVKPTPDVVLVQILDNDMRCDGTDPANYGPFGETVTRVLDRLVEEVPDVQVFFVSPWANADLWTDWVAGHADKRKRNSGTGPCAVFDSRGRRRPEGIRSQQEIIDAYRAEISAACSKHPGCFTDEGAELSFVPTDADVASDLSHLSVAGHRKYAEIAWQALPDEIKDRR